MQDHLSPEQGERSPHPYSPQRPSGRSQPRLPVWFWVSVTLHGLILFLPLWPTSSPPNQDDEIVVDEINLTSLPPTDMEPSPPPLPPPPTLPVPTPAPPLAPSLSTLPPPSPVTVPSTPVQSPVVSPSPPPMPATPQEEEPDLLPEPDPTPTPAPTPVIPVPTPIPTAVPTSEVFPEPMANFPHLEGAEPGCDGLEQCWQIPDSHWRGIAQTLQTSLLRQGYALNELELENDTGRRVYEVIQDGEIVYYLTLVSTFEETIYRLTADPMTTAEIDELAGF